LASNILMCCELIGYVALAVWLHMRQPPGEQTWGGLDIRTALRGWPAFLKIAIPGMGAICLDWW
jgi:MATE family multidrug resistance protein